IELAAARARLLPPEQIAAQLAEPGRAARVLAYASPTAPPRHRALEAAIAWSHDLLSEPERRLFRRLAGFARGGAPPGGAGGGAVEAAEGVGTGDGIAADDVLDLLAALVEKSLVVVDGEQREARFRLLEPIRQYAWERLAGTGELEAVRRRHAGFFAAVAERA